MQSFLDTVPPEHQDRCHTMSGRNVSSTVSPAHRLFESAAKNSAITTIGIGDGGNEIGMGKLPWDLVRRNIPGGGLIACRIPTQYLIVCGISNWGAYGLAAGIRTLRDAPPDSELFNPEIEFGILEEMVERGPLVDGVTGLRCPTVDGLSFENYATVLQELGTLDGKATDHGS